MWGLIKKDLLRRWRNPLSTIVMIAFPLFMSAALGSIYTGGGDGEQAFPRITVLVQNLDEEGFLANALLGALGQDEAQEYLDVIIVGDEGRQMMEKGEASALVVLPVDFTAHILAGEPTEIAVVRNPAEGIKPEIITQGVHVVATYLDQAARLLNKELGVLNEMLNAERLPDAAKVGALAAGVMGRIDGVETYLFPPLVTIGSVKETKADEDGSGGGNGIFGYLLVMTTVMALLFTAIRSVSDIHDEHNSGMLRRQLATPLDIGLVIGAKTVFGVLLGVIVLTTLAVIGLILGWITPPVDLPGAVILAVVFSLAACGVMAVIISLTRNEKQAGILSWLVIMGMSALGGSLIPVSQMPDAMQGAATFTINYWAIDGFTRLVVSGEGIGDILPNLAVLLAVGVISSGLAHVLLVRRYREMSS